MTKILDCDNTVYDLDTVPDEVDDVRFCVLDTADSEDIDFYFRPLIFLESFHAPAVCLDIGGKIVQVPMDWHILISDEDRSEIELLPITSLNNRGFRALVTNPLTSRMPDTRDIEIATIYQDVKWYLPRLKHGSLLVVPIEDKPEPECVFIVKDANKVNPLDFGEIV